MKHLMLFEDFHSEDLPFKIEKYGSIKTPEDFKKAFAGKTVLMLTNKSYSSSNFDGRKNSFGDGERLCIVHSIDNSDSCGITEIESYNVSKLLNTRRKTQKYSNGDYFAPVTIQDAFNVFQYVKKQKDYSIVIGDENANVISTETLNKVNDMLESIGKNYRKVEKILRDSHEVNWKNSRKDLSKFYLRNVSTNRDTYTVSKIWYVYDTNRKTLEKEKDMNCFGFLTNSDSYNRAGEATVFDISETLKKEILVSHTEISETENEKLKILKAVYYNAVNFLKNHSKKRGENVAKNLGLLD